MIQIGQTIYNISYLVKLGFKGENLMLKFSDGSIEFVDRFYFDAISEMWKTTMTEKRYLKVEKNND